MKRSSRLLIALLVVEILLGGIAMWLLSALATGDLHATNSPQETAATVTSVIGAVMGGLAGLGGVGWFLLRRRGL